MAFNNKQEHFGSNETYCGWRNGNRCVATLLLCSIYGLIGNSSEAQHPTLSGNKAEPAAGVCPAPPDMICFDRVSPLLDSLYEEVAAIGLSALTMCAMNLHDASLDAVQHSIMNV